jgi:endonuclease/exonuclease/phosphatase family metal-dependent hydrolase
MSKLPEKVKTEASAPTVPEVSNHAGSVLRWPLTVVAFNVHGDRRLPSTIDVLKEHHVLRLAAVVVLCEAVRVLSDRDRRHVAEHVAAALGMNYAYVPVFHFRGERRVQGRRAVGNALLARAPLTEIDMIELPGRDATMRRLGLLGTPKGLTASVSVEGQPVRLDVAHLDNRWNPSGRELQMRRFLAVFAATGPPLIGGDWNTTTADLGRPGWLLDLATGFMVDRQRLRRPEPYEPLFSQLDQRGFETRNANARPKPTFTPSGLVPRFFAAKARLARCARS